MSTVVVNPGDAQDEREAAGFASDHRKRAVSLGIEPAHPAHAVSQNQASGETVVYQTYGGLSKREHIAAMMLHAEFLSSAVLEAPAQALAEAAEAAGQTIEQRMAINALRVTDALLLELSR